LVEAITTKPVDMGSKSELLVQSNTKVTHNRGEGEKGEGSSKGSHVQPGQLLARAQPDELGFGRVKPQPVR